MPYVDLDGGIAGYYEIHGAGPPMLLLHGGYCSIETLQAQIDHLAPAYEVHAPERPGQGRTADREGPITFDHMVRDTLSYLDGVGLPAAHVVGFSDGAITGLLLARDHPDRVLSLVAISGNLDPDAFVPDDESADESTQGGEEEGPDAFAEAYDRLSPDGPAHREVVLDKLLTMWRSLPQIAPESLGAITAPTLVMAGQHDSIRTDHTLAIAAAIPGAQVAIMPGAGHLVMQERPALVNLLISDFLAEAQVRGAHERTGKQHDPGPSGPGSSGDLPPDRAARL